MESVQSCIRNMTRTGSQYFVHHVFCLIMRRTITQLNQNVCCQLGMQEDAHIHSRTVTIHHTNRP